MDELNDRVIVGISHALFMNRLHLLRLTEVVRLSVRPDPGDGNMELPSKLDDELKQQALDYVLTCLPSEHGKLIRAASVGWLRLQ